MAVVMLAIMDLSNFAAYCGARAAKPSSDHARIGRAGEQQPVDSRMCRQFLALAHVTEQQANRAFGMYPSRRLSKTSREMNFGSLRLGAEVMP